jgi:UDP-N-acetylmuramoylalanine--D-glutamate ligase
MIPVTTFTGRKLALFGLGSSGLASCRALVAGGAQVVAFDDDPKKVAEATAAGIATADLRRIDWAGIAAFVLTPGVPLTHPAPHWSVGLARAAAVEVIGDIELFCRERARHVPDAPFVGVTGTNGKSTTTALIGHVLATAKYDVQIGGNLGTPVLDLAPLARRRHYVLELSSFQIDLTPSLAASVAVLINLSEDHLDRHGTMDNYAAIKERLIAGMQADGTAIVGVDDNRCQAIADRAERRGARVLRVSVRRPLSDGLYVEGDEILLAAGGSANVTARLGGISALRGRHNAQNAGCAAGALLALGLDAAAIQNGLVSFPGLPHRLEEVGRKGRVVFINDSKATNADSAARALACFSDIFWIAGGKAKMGGITSLTEYFPRIRKAYLIGEAAVDFAITLRGRAPHELVDTLDRAVELAAREAEQSASATPVVLLSPACASYDQFANFEVRGTAFRDRVRALPGVRAP